MAFEDRTLVVKNVVQNLIFPLPSKNSTPKKGSKMIPPGAPNVVPTGNANVKALAKCSPLPAHNAARKPRYLLNPLMIAPYIAGIAINK